MSKKSCTFAPQKFKKLIFESMFGVKCSNQPITGKFAEEFVRNLLEAQKHPKEELDDQSIEIICE